jgi:5'-3' exonuclease
MLNPKHDKKLFLRDAFALMIEPYFRAFNIPIIQEEGFEADDVIGTNAKIAEKIRPFS